MSILNRILRYLSLWLRPPNIAALNFEECDQSSLPFVSPVFVLSTGRCGTKWLSELLRLDPRLHINHSDYPELIRHSRLAYECYDQEPRIFQEIIRASRDGYILNAYRHHQTYIETNNRITFFAYAIKQVYPDARYIHLVRHPGNFVRSGLRRDWYQGERHDVGRIRHNDPELWKKLTDTAKIAWLWNETNQYIEDFLKNVEPDQFFQIKIEQIWNNIDVCAEICRFLGAKIDHKDIASMLDRKINQQLIGSIPNYKYWDNKKKLEVRQYALLNKLYKYDI